MSVREREKERERKRERDNKVYAYTWTTCSITMAHVHGGPVCLHSAHSHRHATIAHVQHATWWHDTGCSVVTRKPVGV